MATRTLTAGSNVALDISVPNVITVNVPMQSGTIYGQNGSAGTLAATYDRHITLPSLAVAANSSGRHRVFGIRLPAGLSITNISFYSGNTAGASMTNQWFSLSNSALVCLARTVDDTVNAWGANAKKTLALQSGPFVTTYSGLHYVGCLVASTLTQPNHEGVNTNNVGARAVAPLLSGDTDTGFTTPVAVGTQFGAIGLQAIVFYAELS